MVVVVCVVVVVVMGCKLSSTLPQARHTSTTSPPQIVYKIKQARNNILQFRQTRHKQRVAAEHGPRTGRRFEAAGARHPPLHPSGPGPSPAPGPGPRLGAKPGSGTCRRTPHPEHEKGIVVATDISFIFHLFHQGSSGVGGGEESGGGGSPPPPLPHHSKRRKGNRKTQDLFAVLTGFSAPAPHHW